MPYGIWYPLLKPQSLILPQHLMGICEQSNLILTSFTSPLQFKMNLVSSNVYKNVIIYKVFTTPDHSDTHIELSSIGFPIKSAVNPL